MAYMRSFISSLDIASDVIRGMLSGSYVSAKRTAVEYRHGISSFTTTQVRIGVLGGIIDVVLEISGDSYVDSVNMTAVEYMHSFNGLTAK